MLLDRSNETSWVFPALKSTSHFLSQSRVSHRSDSRFKTQHKLKAVHLPQYVCSFLFLIWDRQKYIDQIVKILNKAMPYIRWARDWIRDCLCIKISEKCRNTDYSEQDCEMIPIDYRCECINKIIIVMIIISVMISYSKQYNTIIMVISIIGFVLMLELQLFMPWFLFLWLCCW